MAKKDFSSASMANVYGAIAEATAAPAQEAQPVQAEQPAQQQPETQEAQPERRIVIGRYGIPHEYKPQSTADEAEQAQRMADLRTQGRKGCSAPRINMAFSAENYEFIKIMASVTGMNLTQFCNIIIDRYREEHPELYEKAKAIKDSL